MSWWLPVGMSVALVTYAAWAMAVQEIRAARALKGLANQRLADFNVILAACVDYRRTLRRAAVMDPVSARPDGVEAICKRYGVTLEPRSYYGERP